MTFPLAKTLCALLFLDKDFVPNLIGRNYLAKKVRALIMHDRFLLNDNRFEGRQK